MALDPTRFAYIIPATSQFLDENGQPLVGGRCVLYIHGSSGTPYQSYQNFEGTENPLEIPINILGYAPAIGSIDQSYDLYVYDANRALAYSRLNLGAHASGSGEFELHIDRTLQGSSTPNDPLGVNVPEVIDGLVRGVVPESDNVHVRTRQYLSDGSIMVGIKVDEPEPYTGGPGIKVEDHEISLDTDALSGSSMTAQGSSNVTVNLNSGLTELSHEGSDIFLENGVLKVKAGTYHIDAFIQFLGTPDTSEYDLKFTGPNGSQLEYHYDNTFSHREIILFSFDFITAIDNSTLPLALDTTTAPASYAMMLHGIHAFKVATAVANEGATYTAGPGINIDPETNEISADFTTVQKKLVAGDHITIDPQTNEISADIPEQQQADWNQTDSSAVDYIKNKPEIANVPAVNSGDDRKVLMASYSGGIGSYSWQVAPTGVPDSTASDSGKILTVLPDGTPSWEEPAAQPQVQSDWTESDTTDPSYIQNKPESVEIQAGRNIEINEVNGRLKVDCTAQVLPASTSADEGKVLGVDSNGDPTWEAAPAFTQKQADWDEANTSDPAYIKNKPDLSVYALAASVPVIGTVEL